MKPEFKGDYKTTDELIAMLRFQGLEIPDPKRAEWILSNVSYSRLKSYLIPLMTDREAHTFKKGATINQAYALYGFDRRLRELIFHEMEKFEISLRTRIAYASSGSENGYWYTNPAYFKNVREHKALLSRIESELRRSDNDSIINFRKKYSTPFPPCWLAMEATTMGTLQYIYSDMKSGGIKTKIADYYGVSETVLLSWIQNLIYVRNYCAHHNRLWNKTITVTGIVPENPRNEVPRLGFGDPHKIYFTLCILKYLVNVIKPENNFAVRLIKLIDDFKPIVETEQYMGFPENWRNDPFWRVF